MRTSETKLASYHVRLQHQREVLTERLTEQQAVSVAVRPKGVAHKHTQTMQQRDIIHKDKIGVYNAFSNLTIRAPTWYRRSNEQTVESRQTNKQNVNILTNRRTQYAYRQAYKWKDTDTT